VSNVRSDILFGLNAAPLIALAVAIVIPSLPAYTFVRNVSDTKSYRNGSGLKVNGSAVPLGPAVSVSPPSSSRIDDVCHGASRRPTTDRMRSNCPMGLNW